MSTPLTPPQAIPSLPAFRIRGAAESPLALGLAAAGCILIAAAAFTRFAAFEIEDGIVPLDPIFREPDLTILGWSLLGALLVILKRLKWLFVLGLISLFAWVTPFLPIEIYDIKPFALEQIRLGAVAGCLAALLWISAGAWDEAGQLRSETRRMMSMASSLYRADWLRLSLVLLAVAFTGFSTGKAIFYPSRTLRYEFVAMAAKFVTLLLCWTIVGIHMASVSNSRSPTTLSHIGKALLRLPRGILIAILTFFLVPIAVDPLTALLDFGQPSSLEHLRNALWMVSYPAILIFALPIQSVSGRVAHAPRRVVTAFLERPIAVSICAGLVGLGCVFLRGVFGFPVERAFSSLMYHIFGGLVTTPMGFVRFEATRVFFQALRIAVMLPILGSLWFATAVQSDRPRSEPKAAHGM